MARHSEDLLVKALADADRLAIRIAKGSAFTFLQDAEEVQSILAMHVLHAWNTWDEAKGRSWEEWLGINLRYGTIEAAKASGKWRSGDYQDFMRGRVSLTDTCFIYTSGGGFARRVCLDEILDPGSSGFVEHVDLHIALTATLDKLKESERQIIEKAYYKGVSTREIAQEMGVSTGWVRALKRKALCSWRDALREWGVVE